MPNLIDSSYNKAEHFFAYCLLTIKEKYMHWFLMLFFYFLSSNLRFSIIAPGLRRRGGGWGGGVGGRREPFITLIIN